MARDPQQVAKVARKPSVPGDPPKDEANHPWSLAMKIVAGLFGTVVAPLIVALILRMMESNPASVPAQPNATQTAEGANTTPMAGAAAPPQPTRPARRFVPLFNGKDFSGWSVAKESYWSVDPAHNTLVGNDPEGIRRPDPHWIHTEKEYGDFRLRFEYRYDGASLGGMSVRRFLPGRPNGGGLRIQLSADDHPRGIEFPTGNVIARGGEGRQLIAKALVTNCQRPTGDWNRAQIEFRGPHLLVRINGNLVQDFKREVGSEQKPAQGTEGPRAPIGLHIVTGKIEFRGLQIEELAAGDP